MMPIFLVGNAIFGNFWKSIIPRFTQVEVHHTKKKSLELKAFKCARISGKVTAGCDFLLRTKMWDPRKKQDVFGSFVSACEGRSQTKACCTHAKGRKMRTCCPHAKGRRNVPNTHTLTKHLYFLTKRMSEAGLEQSNPPVDAATMSKRFR